MIAAGGSDLMLRVLPQLVLLLLIAQQLGLLVLLVNSDDGFFNDFFVLLRGLLRR